MVDLVLKSRALPEPLYQLVSAEKVIVRKEDGEIRLIPLREVGKVKASCPFLGLYTDGKLTVDGYLARKRKEKELER